MATSLPSAHAELAGIIHDDAEKMRVHSFDPDAPPEEKAAMAGKPKEQLKPLSAGGGPGGKELTVDTGVASSDKPPTITVSDADSVPPSAASIIKPPDSAPGNMPDDASGEIPDWYRIGWRQVSEIDRPPLAEGEEKDRSILETWIKEQYYGQWYHNAAVIFFAVAASHFMTVFHLGWGWLFLVLITCASYYSLSMTRVRRHARDDIQRELVKSRLVNESESADWINNFLDRFWLIYEPVLSATVISSVDQILSTNTPPFLDSIRLSTFTLGNKAPRINSVRTYPNTPDDIITMDWSLSFTPSDVSDLTPAQAKLRVNPKIVLSIRVGKGFAGGTIPILLEDIEFAGEMTIRLKLMTNFPHIQILDLSFKKPPVIDYVLKPIGGETLGFDIAHIPGLSSFIREMTHSNLGPMMYAPNVFTLNLEQMLSGAPINTAVGVLQITVHSARSLKGVKIGGGAPDPYVAISISQRAILASTSWKDSTYNPSWNETKFILVNSLTDTLTLVVMDHNDHRADGEIGTVSFDLAQLGDDAERPNIAGKVLRDGKEKGELRYDISFYPVLKPAKQADGTEEPVPETKVGIVRLTVHQAKDLDHTKSLSGDLNPFAVVTLGSSKEPIHSTPRFKHTNNPVWESATEFLCTDKASSVIGLQVVDDRSMLADPIVGYRVLPLTEILDSKKEGVDWFNLNGCKSGRIRMTAEWKPLNMAGSLQGADQYVPPIGVVRLWIQKATDVKNVEAALGGKSDPYLRVLVNNIIEGRTEVISNNLNPQWDQIMYIPVHSIRESLILECMDYQHLTKDRSLGTTELKVSDLASDEPNGSYRHNSKGKKTIADPLHLDKSTLTKGLLHYGAEFIPSYNLANVGFTSQANESSNVEHDSKTDGSSNSSATAAKDERAEGAANAVDMSVTHDGISMPINELLSHQSGIIIFNVISGEITKKARLEILIDDGYWPACSTPKATSLQANWNYVGEGFIKELDFSRVWLRLNANDENEKEDVIGELKIEAMKFVQETLASPVTYTLNGVGDRESSHVEIVARYVPVDIQLEPRESLNNQGTLRVELIDGSELHGVDRGGKSDPYVIFTLNGQKVFKSQTKKKTVNPEWNETFAIPISSRVGSDLILEVFDWNQIEQAKSLGVGTIRLDDLEPFQGVERKISLQHDKHGNKGEIRVILTFQPEIIAKSRKNTSTFSTAGRAVTQIGSMPLEGAKGVVHGVGSAGSKMTGIFKKDHARNNLSVEDETSVPPVAGQASRSVDAHAPLSPFPTQVATTDNNIAPQSGVLKVTVISGKDLSITGSTDLKDLKPYVALRMLDKEYKTKHQSCKGMTFDWNETFCFSVGAETRSLALEVIDHKTFGKDKLIADGTVEVWDHVRPSGTTGVEVWVELRDGTGQLRLRLDFERGQALGRGSSSLSLSNGSSSASPSRFMSLRKKSVEE